MLKYSIGIDISSKTFDVVICVIDGQQKVTFKSSKSRILKTLQGFKVLLAWIEKHYKNKEIPLVTCMEATGIYYENCAMFLFQAGYQVSVLLPNKAKKYMQSLGLKSKNDSIDSRSLAQMGELDVFSTCRHYLSLGSSKRYSATYICEHSNDTISK